MLFLVNVPTERPIKYYATDYRTIAKVGNKWQLLDGGKMILPESEDKQCLRTSLKMAR